MNPNVRHLYYNQVMNEINNSVIHPIYLLFGEEILLADKMLNLLKEKFLGKCELELNYFSRYAAEEGIDNIISLGSGMTLFSDKKLIVLKDAHLLKSKDIAKLLKFFEYLPSGICFILQTHLTSLSQSRLKDLEGHITLVNLLPLKSNELAGYIKTEFKKLDKDITPGAIQMMIFLVGTQLSDLSNQINMSAQYYREQDVIDTTEIEQITSIYATRDIYELASTISLRALNRSIFILHNLLSGGTLPQQILNQLLRHFSILWRIKGYYRQGIRNSSTIGRELKIYIKYLNEYSEQSMNWSTDSLREVFKLLLKADKEIRDPTVHPEITLDILTRKIINC